jgi:hypothetical protein
MEADAASGAAGRAAETRGLDPETLEGLESLGYLE